MNLVRNVPVAIGSVQEGQVTLTSAVTYQDGAPQVYQTIPFSFSNGLSPEDYMGESRFQLFAGVDLAMSSDRSLLQYHSLRQVNLSLGFGEFDEAWARQQVANHTRSSLGVAMLASVYSSVAIGVYEVLDSLHIALPQISATNTAMALSSNEAYPLYMRVVMSDAYMSVLYGKMLKHFGWANIGLLYTNDTHGVGIYETLLTEMRSLNITIRNAANTRALPDNPSDQQLLQAASALVVSKARILVLLLVDNDVNRAIAALYDLGMRRGDVVFLAVEWLGPELFQQSDSLMQMKILELCSGAIQFFPASKVGAIGQTFEAQYQAAYHMESPFYACFYYDAAYLLAYALDYMITRGKDYTQPLALNTALSHPLSRLHRSGHD